MDRRDLHQRVKREMILLGIFFALLLLLLVAALFPHSPMANWLRSTGFIK